MVKRTERLQGSKRKRDDEYYTLFNDIAADVSLYLPQLSGKRILCPCDWDESYNEEIVYKEEGYMLEIDREEPFMLIVIDMHLIPVLRL